MTKSLAESDLDKIAEYLVRTFPKAAELNEFLVKRVWPRYRNSRPGEIISPVFRHIDGSEATISQVERMRVGGRMLQWYNNEWVEVEKRRRGLFMPVSGGDRHTVTGRT